MKSFDPREVEENDTGGGRSCQKEGLKINQMSYLGRRQQGTKAAAARKGKSSCRLGLKVINKLS